MRNLSFKVLNFIVGLSYVCIKEMYSKCHMSLTLKMCMTHENFDITENLQELSCVCPCLANVCEM